MWKNQPQFPELKGLFNPVIVMNRTIEQVFFTGAFTW